MTNKQEKLPTINVTENIMNKHLIAFLIKYIKVLQHITDDKSAIDHLIKLWSNQFRKNIQIAKKATAQVYAEQQCEDYDIWNILIDTSTFHIEMDIDDFTEKMRKVLYEYMKVN